MKRFFTVFAFCVFAFQFVSAINVSHKNSEYAYSQEKRDLPSFCLALPGDKSYYDGYMVIGVEQNPIVWRSWNFVLNVDYRLIPIEEADKVEFVYSNSPYEIGNEIDGKTVVACSECILCLYSPSANSCGIQDDEYYLYTDDGNYLTCDSKTNDNAYTYKICVLKEEYKDEPIIDGGDDNGNQGDTSNGYNYYLSSTTTGYSLIFMGYVRKVIGFDITNNGSESIVLNQVTFKNASTLETEGSSTDQSLLGVLEPGASKSLQVTIYKDIDLVYEWEYTYNGNTYVFKSWETYPNPNTDGIINITDRNQKKVIKKISNGKIIIEKDNKFYNLDGSYLNNY